jgi:sorting nexin-29
MQIAEDKIGEYQCGFRKGRSTSDQIFVLHQTIEKFPEYGKDLHILFTDCKKAFNSVTPIARATAACL